MTAHSKIGASSYYRWKACPRSVKLSEGVKQSTSVYAEEGTHAHTVAELLTYEAVYDLCCWKKSQKKMKELAEWISDAPDEMIDACNVYVDTVLDDVRGALESGADVLKSHFLLEHKFDLEQVHPGLFGTADCVFYDPLAKLLRVYDYKHGAGIAVSVEDNLQLQYYGTGALLSTGFPCSNIELVIAQPRCFHPDGYIRRSRFPSINMIDYMADLKKDALATEDDNAKIEAGDHCRFCPAAANKCPKLQEKAKAMVKTEFSPAADYDPNKLSDTLKWLPILEAWCKNVREFAYSELKSGVEVPDYKMVQKRATRKWISETVAREKLKKLSSEGISEEDILTVPKLKTPAQVEKAIGKDKKYLIKDLFESISSGTTMVHESDSRKAVESSSASEDFS